MGCAPGGVALLASTSLVGGDVSEEGAGEATPFYDIVVLEQTGTSGGLPLIEPCKRFEHRTDIGDDHHAQAATRGDNAVVRLLNQFDGCVRVDSSS